MSQKIVNIGLIRIMMVVICVFVTSMFYFPFDFRALPGMNTKKMLAAIALVILLMKMVYHRNLFANKEFIHLSIFASMVSVCGFISVTYNNTTDYAYATYLTSFWVWWGAAYTVCCLIKWIHGKLTWELAVSYLTAVCVFQCIIALVMDENRAVKNFINSIVMQGDLVFEGGVHRLYGIGASLDVAGMRFAAVLVLIVYLLANTKIAKRWYEYFLFFVSFIIITTAGNMIARTTLVGIAVSLIYLAFITIRQTKEVEQNYMTMWKWIGGLLVLSIPLMVYSYQSDPKMKKNFRFAFEGFFNLAERGDFNYSSNDKLKRMYVWPDNIKTWGIGDGYFDNPVVTDPYYTGERTIGYYKNTDVGYLRFIYYFGVIGLLCFSFFFLKVGQTCARKFPEKKVLFGLLLIVHFIVWAKVSSDIFLVFAMFLCFDEKEDEEEALIQTSQSD